MSTELKERLQALAYAKTFPFCYGCYARAPSGTCTKCGSDDLMRELPGEGVEYGTDWVIESLVRGALEPVDTSEVFENSLEGIYPETTKIGFIEYDTISAMKELDPVAFRMAESEYVDSLVSDGELLEIGSRYYWLHDLENYLDQEEAEVRHVS